MQAVPFSKLVARVGLCILVWILIGCAAAQHKSAPPNQAPASETDAQQALPDPAVDSGKQITAITVQETDDGCEIVLHGTQLLTFTAIKQASPPAVLLYIPEAQLAPSVASPMTVNNGAVTTISAGNLTENDTVRVEIALARELPYHAARQGDNLIIRLPGNGQLPAPPPKTAPLADTAPAFAPAPTPPPVAAPATIDATEFQAITVDTAPNAVTISIAANGAVSNYQSFCIDNPPRIVFDLNGLKSQHTQEMRHPVNAMGVRQVRHFSYPDHVRLVIDADSDLSENYEARSTPAGMIITIAPPTGAPVAVAAPIAPDTDTPADDWADVPEIEIVETDMVPITAIEPVGPPATIDRINFTSEPDGRATLLIATTRPVSYHVLETDKRQVKLALPDAALPKDWVRPLLTDRSLSAVDRIDPLIDPNTGNARFDIALRQAVPFFIDQNNNLLRVHFEAPAKPATPPDTPLTTAQLVPDVKTSRPDALPQEIDVIDLEAETAPARLLTGRGPKQYTGQKISLDFYDTDIKNVFRIMREISGQNFAIDQNVKGKVTLTFAKPVPWDQVLDLILKMNQLGMTYEGDIIRIATLGTLQKEKDLARAALESEKKALEQEKALEPLLTEYIPISYSSAGDIIQHLQKIKTKDRGSLSNDARTQTIIMEDTEEKIQLAKEIVRRLDRVTPQVVIEARIVEASDTFNRNLGIEWGAAGGITNTSASAGIGPQRGYDAIGGTYGWDVAFNPPSIPSTAVLGFDFMRIAGTALQINAQLLALESEDQVKIVSAPKVLTLDNKTALIKQGIEYPYLRTTGTGADKDVSTQFKQIDLTLEVTPHITPDNRISMNVHITKDDIYALTDDGPALTTKEAQTELLVNDGDTIVIGGIIKNNLSIDKQGIPWLSNIPGLGWLFKSEMKGNEKQELIIFITPRIVQLEQRSQ